MEFARKRWHIVIVAILFLPPCFVSLLQGKILWFIFDLIIEIFLIIAVIKFKEKPL